MGKTTDETKLFVRFLREKGIKYIYAKEALRNAYRKKYSHLLSNGVDGNLLKYFNKLISRGFYDVIGRSFTWSSTKNGHEFWRKMNDMWFDYYFKKA